MERKDVTEKFENIEVTKVLRVGGEFENESGNKINWHGYKVELDLGNYKVRAKIDKVFTEVMDDIVEGEE